MVDSDTYTTKDAQETRAVGGNVARLVLSGEYPPVVCLTGALGSGKTTFVQGFASQAGVSSRMISPTFIIVRSYDLAGAWDRLVHIDLYRLTSARELPTVGLDEILSQDTSIVLIEWSERLGDTLPKNRVDVRCRAMEDGRHQIGVEVIHG